VVNHRIIANASARCVAGVGYYQNSSRVAPVCVGDCAACTSASNCLYCKAGVFLQPNGVCLTTCPPRFFASQVTHTCRGCPYDCYTCNDQGQCLSCNVSTDFRMLSTATMRCVSVPGYYDELKTVSTACPVSCATCLLATYCLSCTAGYYFGLDNLCYASCPVRTYPDQATFTCLRCPYDCYTCNKLGLCLTCDPLEHRILSTQTARCVAMVGYF
jgi:proprotein convertase subtilisin/kexin type 5